MPQPLDYLWSRLSLKGRGFFLGLPLVIIVTLASAVPTLALLGCSPSQPTGTPEPPGVTPRVTATTVPAASQEATLKFAPPVTTTTPDPAPSPSSTTVPAPTATLLPTLAATASPTATGVPAQSSPPTPTPAPTSSPTPAPHPTATPAPSAEPAPLPTSTTTPLATATMAPVPSLTISPAIFVVIVSLTSPIPRGNKATLSAKTSPGTLYSIIVQYKSGPSSASGLEPKAAPEGNVSWTWTVGSRTTAGEWPIEISCGLDGQRATVTTKITVEA